MEPGMRQLGGRETVPAARILRRGARSGRLMHVEEIPGRPGEGVPWPDWVPDEITQSLSRAGVVRPWAHQAAMAEHAHQGRSVIISTPAASGKSLGYLLPALTAVLGGSTVLYLRRPGRPPPVQARPCGRSASVGYARPWWMGTPWVPSGSGREPGRTICSPPPTCSTTDCCRGTRGGGSSLAASST